MNRNLFLQIKKYFASQFFNPRIYTHTNQAQFSTFTALFSYQLIAQFFQPERATAIQSQFAPLILKFVRPAFPFRAQPQLGRATWMATCISCLRQSPRARCLTFTLAPIGAGPGCCSGLPRFRSQPFHYPRARFHAPPRSNTFTSGNTSGCSMLARGSGINVSRYRGILVDVSSLRSSICQPQQPGLTAPTLPPPSALFRPRPMTDSSALPPLHSTPRPLKMKQAPAAFVPLAANCRDSQEQLGRAQRRKTPMAARLRPAKRSALWARCFACRPGQYRRHSRETDQLCFAALTNRPDSLMVAIRKDV